MITFNVFATTSITKIGYSE